MRIIPTAIALLLAACAVDIVDEADLHPDAGDGAYNAPGVERLGEKGLSTSPTGKPVASVGGAENCPPDMEEAGRCTPSGGGGGGGGDTPDEQRCLVPGWVWYPQWRRCAPGPGSWCGTSPSYGQDCYINIVGQCECPRGEPWPIP